MSHTRNTESDLIKKFHEEWAVKNGYRPQAASFKPQAASVKLQAASGKLLNLRTLIKFHVAGSKVLNHDEGILRM